MTVENHNLLDVQQAIKHLKEHAFLVEMLDRNHYRVTKGKDTQVMSAREIVVCWHEQLKMKHLIEDSSKKKTKHFKLLEESTTKKEVKESI